jgi:predicted RNA-binding protein with PUA-like domain
MRHWLFKTEPSTYSFEQLVKDKKTHWNGIRNYQARNFLKEVAQGDPVIIYHSGDDKAAVGVAKVLRNAYPDPDPETPGVEWFQVDIAPVKAFRQAVTLKTIKATASLSSMMLVKSSRLSAMPITEAHYKTLLKMGGT